MCIHCACVCVCICVYLGMHGCTCLLGCVPACVCVCACMRALWFFTVPPIFLHQHFALLLLLLVFLLAGPLALALFVPSAVTGCLAYWQYERSIWKEDLINSRAQMLESPPLNVYELEELKVCLGIKMAFSFTPLQWQKTKLSFFLEGLVCKGATSRSSIMRCRRLKKSVQMDALCTAAPSLWGQGRGGVFDGYSWHCM